MIGSLVKYSIKKRMLYFPSQATYECFDGCVGLVTSYTKKDGHEHVRVQWVKPVVCAAGKTLAPFADFNLLNFEIISVA